MPNEAAASPTSRWPAGRFGPELGHLPEHRDALAVGLELRQGAQGRFHRVGVGVVAVVDELHAADGLDLQPRLSERRGREAGRALFE